MIQLKEDNNILKVGDYILCISNIETWIGIINIINKHSFNNYYSGKLIYINNKDRLKTFNINNITHFNLYKEKRPIKYYLLTEEEVLLYTI